MQAKGKPVQAGQREHITSSFAKSWREPRTSTKSSTEGVCTITRACRVCGLYAFKLYLLKRKNTSSREKNIGGLEC
ncbi:hypothetical protein SORBI_3004G032600 [Sorghum bicolor]|uniref:Uncharacterized protein n=1 Tax=Sorghum bicolor TaxID=4558 RepID=A0A194YMI4_SORBI|nr:hypothetical protein SORBI_3004G032600 [Sorghum bicolor]